MSTPASRGQRNSEEKIMGFRVSEYCSGGVHQVGLTLDIPHLIHDHVQGLELRDILPKLQGSRATGTPETAHATEIIEDPEGCNEGTRCRKGTQTTLQIRNGRGRKQRMTTGNRGKTHRQRRRRPADESRSLR